MKNFSVELAIITIIATAILSAFMAGATSVGTELTFGVAALVSGLIFVVSLVVTVSKTLHSKN